MTIAAATTTPTTRDRSVIPLRARDRASYPVPNSAVTDLRVVIADDDVLLRSGVARLLDRSGMSVVGEAGDAATFVELVREQRPDLVLVDIGMPALRTEEGLEAARKLREELPDVAIVALSTHVETEIAATLLSYGGGVGYLLKDRVVDVDDFVDTLRRVARGVSVVDPAVLQELVALRLHPDPLASLSPREYDVLRLMAEGRSNLGVAEALWVTEGTVEKHVRNILAKLGIAEGATDHRRVLAVIAYLHGSDAGAAGARPQLAASR